jgi:hypothetical protein
MKLIDLANMVRLEIIQAFGLLIVTIASSLPSFAFVTSSSSIIRDHILVVELQGTSYLQTLVFTYHSTYFIKSCFKKQMIN